VDVRHDNEEEYQLDPPGREKILSLGCSLGRRIDLLPS